MIALVHFLDGLVIAAGAGAGEPEDPLVQVGQHSVALIAGVAESDSRSAILGALESVDANGPNGDEAAAHAATAFREKLPADPSFHTYDVVVATYRREAQLTELWKISSVVDVSNSDDTDESVSAVQQSVERLPRTNVFVGRDAIATFALGVVGNSRRLSVNRGAKLLAWGAYATSATLADYGEPQSISFASITREGVRFVAQSRLQDIRNAALAVDSRVRGHLSGVFQEGGSGR